MSQAWPPHSSAFALSAIGATTTEAFVSARYRQSPCKVTPLASQFILTKFNSRHFQFDSHLLTYAPDSTRSNLKSRSCPPAEPISRAARRANQTRRDGRSGRTHPSNRSGVVPAERHWPRPPGRSSIVHQDRHRLVPAERQMARFVSAQRQPSHPQPCAGATHEPRSGTPALGLNPATQRSR